MAALAPPVAAVRVAVRRCLAAHAVADGAGGARGAGGAGSAHATRPHDRSLVLVACSGGPDSLALASAAGFEVPRLDLRCGLVTVDHGLQEGSAARAAEVAAWAREQGFAPVLAVPVEVAGRPGGPEAAARQARYHALAAAAEGTGATAVLLGHTRDDQAETVLLALARGAGPRGLAGMPELRICHGVRFLRPLLDVPREDTRAACAALGLRPWEDPHNSDPAYARSRVRAALPVLVEALGPDLVANLARTATLLAADAEFLDTLAERAAADAAAGGVTDAAGEIEGNVEGLAVSRLVALPGALRTRVLHGWARSLGVPGSALSYRHVVALDALVTAWHGQGPVALPGGIEVARRAGHLAASAPDTPRDT